MEANIKPSRTGKVTEYKRGHNYMTVVEWEDGHCEIEVHECIPKLIFHSCDNKELQNAQNLFNGLPKVTYPALNDAEEKLGDRK